MGSLQVGEAAKMYRFDAAVFKGTEDLWGYLGLVITMIPDRSYH